MKKMKNKRNLICVISISLLISALFYLKFFIVNESKGLGIITDILITLTLLFFYENFLLSLLHIFLSSKKSKNN